MRKSGKFNWREDKRPTSYVIPIFQGQAWAVAYFFSKVFQNLTVKVNIGTTLLFFTKKSETFLRGARRKQRRRSSTRYGAKPQKTPALPAAPNPLLYEKTLFTVHAVLRHGNLQPLIDVVLV